MMTSLNYKSENLWKLIEALSSAIYSQPDAGGWFQSCNHQAFHQELEELIEQMRDTLTEMDEELHDRNLMIEY